MHSKPCSKQSVTAQAASAANRDEQEFQLQQAAAEVHEGQHSSIHAAAAANNVPKSTLCHRLQGQQLKKDAQTNQQSLTPAAESVLVNHIQHCSCSGYPLAPAHILEYASSISHSIPGQSKPVDVGHKWLQGFLLCHPSLKSCWSRCLDNACLRGTDEEGVRQWFACLSNIITEYNIGLGDMYNMDETGFLVGCGGSKRVLVPEGNPAACFKAQPGYWEWATVIECIGSAGQVLPPLIIMKGQIHTVGEQQRMVNIPQSWYFSKLDNGWTDNELAVHWLEKVFDNNTRPSSSSSWHLLLLDGHKSHISPKILDAMWS